MCCPQTEHPTLVRSATVPSLSLSPDPTRDIESSGGFRTDACSGGFCTMDLGFSVPVSAPRFGKNRHWISVFPSLSSYGFGLFLGLDLPPFVRGVGPSGVAEGDPEQRRPSKFGIACLAALGDFDEAERLGLADAGCNTVPVYAVRLEVVVRHRQFAVIVSALVRKLNFETREHAKRAHRQR